MAAIRRKVDDLGRVVIPKKWRKQIGLLEYDEVDIDLQGDKIIIAKAHETCVICGKLKEEVEIDSVIHTNGKYIGDSFVCNGCIDEIKKGGR